MKQIAADSRPLRSQKFRALFAAGTASLLSAGLLHAANTEYDVNNGSTDLTAAATYSTGGTAGTGVGGTSPAGNNPSVTSDVTIDSGIAYSPSAFTLNVNATFGSLNDLSTTAITLDNKSGTPDTLTLGGTSDLGDSVPGSTSSDLLFVGSSASVNLGSSSTAALGIALGQSGNLDVAGTATVGSAISGSGFGLTKTGAGALTITGSNIYTGTTAISAGTLILSGSNSNGATATTTVAAAATLQLQANSGNTTAGVSSALGTAAGKLTLSSGSTLQLRGNTTGTTFSGGDSFNALNATVTIDVNNNGSGSGNTLNFAVNGSVIQNFTLNVTGGNGYGLALGTLTDYLSSATSTDTFNPTTANLSISSLTGSSNHTHAFILGGTSTGNAITGAITSSNGTTTVTKSGTSTWTLSGTNTYAGATSVNGGLLILSGVSGTGSGAATVNAGTLQLQANTANTTAGVSSALGTASGKLNLANGSTLQLRGNNNGTTFGGGDSFGGDGGATIAFDVNNNGSGTGNTLDFAVNGTAVYNTTLNITGGNGYGLALGTLTDVGSSGTSTDTFNPTTANLSLTTLAGSAAGTHAFVLGGTSAGNVVTGAISNASGTSTWTLATASSYTGATTISAGKLTITNTGGSATGASGVALSGGVNTTLSGTGISTGALTVTNGSRLAPGVNTTDADASGHYNFGVAGKLSVGATGGITLTSANLDLDLSASASGNNDSIATGGALVLTSVTLNINETGGALQAGTAYVLISGATSVTGADDTNFSNFTTTFAGGSTYTPTYSIDGSNDLDVTFSAVSSTPEPASLALVAMGGLGLIRRRRRTMKPSERRAHSLTPHRRSQPRIIPFQM